MNTHFDIPTNKPFRGITTIQLFDKDSKIVEEVVHENTYNQRIQFRNYLDTILHCKSTDINSTASFALSSSDEAISGTYSDNITYKNFWDTSGASSRVRQPFATLWLTNKTDDETPNGYPNGIPVTVADSSGVPNNIANVLSTGQINLQESFFGNDRLHLVFDFDTVHSNITFDSLWLFPSYYRAGQSGSSCYHVLPFFQKQLISNEEDTSFNIPFQFRYVKQEQLNGDYSMLWFSDSYNNRAQVRQVLIFNTKTGAILADCTFETGTPIYGSFYYDAGSNQLYMIHNTSQSGDTPFINSTSNASLFGLYKVNLTTGVRTLVSNMNTLLNMNKGDYGYIDNVTNWRYNVDVYWLSDENTTYLAVPTEGTDAVNGLPSAHYTWFTFDATLETFTFVKRLKVYSGTTMNSLFTNNNFSGSSFIRDDKLYLACYSSPDIQLSNSFAVYNIKTGALIYDKLLSTDVSVYTPSTLSTTQFYTTTNTSLGRAYMDEKSYRNLSRSLSSTVSADAKLMLNKYDTSLWSTHNKLTSAVTKTDQTTMKIQYDIIWDSLNDVIIPGLM